MKRSEVESVAHEGPADSTTASAKGVRHMSTEHDVVRTTCGRELRVGRLSLGELDRPVGRVTLDISCESFDHGEVWASLTPEEARRLAGRLLAHAAIVDREAAESAVTGVEADAGTGTGTGARQAGDPAVVERPPAMDVRYVTGETYAIAVRGHDLLVDQPIDIGGDDTAATPTELLIASLASCVAFYAGRYLTRHKADRAGLRVTADFDMATDRPARVSAVRLRVTVPPGLPKERRSAMQAVVEHCTVHNTLHRAPEVTIDLV